MHVMKGLCLSVKPVALSLTDYQGSFMFLCATEANIYAWGTVIALLSVNCGPRERESMKVPLCIVSFKNCKEYEKIQETEKFRIALLHDI